MTCRVSANPEFIYRIKMLYDRFLLSELAKKFNVFVYKFASVYASVCQIRAKSGKIRTSGKFGHTFANSVNPDETAPYEPSHRDFHCLLS